MRLNLACSRNTGKEELSEWGQKESGVNDVHVTDLDAGNYYTFTPPHYSCAPFNIIIYNSSSLINSLPVLPENVQSPINFEKSEIGEVVLFESR